MVYSSMKQLIQRGTKEKTKNARQLNLVTIEKQANVDELPCLNDNNNRHSKIRENSVINTENMH